MDEFSTSPKPGQQIWSDNSREVTPASRVIAHKYTPHSDVLVFLRHVYNDLSHTL